MKLARLTIAAALWLGGATAHAQSPAETAAELPSLLRDAFDSAYGKAMVAELGKTLRKNADAACLAEKGIRPDQLEPRGHDLIVKWGLRTMEVANSYIDPKLYDEKFAASAGSGAAAELARLRKNADVKRSAELEQPIQLARIVDMAFEQFDRYVLIKRIKLDTVSPAGSGNVALLKLNPTEAAEEKIDKFLAANKSSALKKYSELSQKSHDARAASTKVDDALKI